MSSKHISTSDLKSERTLNNFRKSKKYLATVNSKGELINEDMQFMMQQSRDNDPIKMTGVTIDERKMTDNNYESQQSHSQLQSLGMTPLPMRHDESGNISAMPSMPQTPLEAAVKNGPED